MAVSLTNFPAVSQSGDDISRYQPPNSENEGFFDNFFQKTFGPDFRRNFTLAFSFHLMKAT